MAHFYPAKHISPQTGKYAIAIFGALVTTFSLFVLMQKLIAVDDVIVTPAPQPVIIDFLFEKQDPTTIEKQRLPKPENKPKSPPSVTRLEPHDNEMSVGFELESVDGLDKMILEEHAFGVHDGSGEARPIVRVQPAYPAQAAREGIEGWVKLVFDVAVDGSVEHIQVLDAEPRRMFDRAARKALAKWKYKPSVINGHAQSQTGLQVVLEFSLTK